MRAHELTGGKTTPVEQPALAIVARARAEMADQSIVRIEQGHAGRQVRYEQGTISEDVKVARQIEPCGKAQVISGKVEVL